MFLNGFASRPIFEFEYFMHFTAFKKEWQIRLMIRRVD